jgi:Domain of unknown function (DUF4352)
MFNRPRQTKFIWPIIFGCAAIFLSTACQSASRQIDRPQAGGEPRDIDAEVTARVEATLAAVPRAAAPTPTPATPAATAVPPTATPLRPTPAPVKPAATQPPIVPTPLPAEAPITFTGSQNFQTEPFKLRGGNYSVAWKGVDATRSRIGCILSGDLTPTSGGTLLGQQRFSRSNTEGQDNAGTTQWYSVKAGEYFLKVNGTCDPWSVAIVTQGTDAVTALPSVTSNAQSTTAATTKKWEVTPISFAESGPTVVSNEYGLTRLQEPTGRFVRATFSVKNLQDRSASVGGSDFSLSDERGRTYETDFQVRQAQGSGSQPFDHSNISPGATVTLQLTFDVAKDANGLTLKMRS